MRTLLAEAHKFTPEQNGWAGYDDCTALRMHRRNFCINAWQAASFLAIGSLLEGCGGSPTSPSDSGPPLTTVNGAVSNRVITVTIAADSPIASVGGAALVQSSAGVFLVFRSAQDAFNVMTAVCTHEQCTITGFASQTFTCPCHGSRFNSSGAVVNGPASRPLQRFTAAVAGNVLTITV